VDLYHKVKTAVGVQGPQGIQGPLGPPGPVGPAGLNWQGAWTSGTSYVEDDAVGFGGASYFCILATNGTTDPDVDTTHWALLASQGAIGPQGAQGPTGPQGPAGVAGVVTYTDGSLNSGTFNQAATFAKLSLNFTRVFVTSPTDNFVGLTDVGVNTGTIYVVQNKSTTRNLIVRPLNNARFLQPSGSELDVNFTVRPNTYARFTLTNITGGSDRVFMVEVINPLGVEVKTRGLVAGGTFPNNETVLPYDINIISVGTGNLFKLPDAAPLGKEIIVNCNLNVATIYPFSGGGIETAVNGQAGQKNVSFNELVKFTSYGNNFWLAETLQRNAPLLDGKDLSSGTFWSLTWVLSTTSPLTLSFLNTTFPSATTLNGFQVFCPSITGGGLVYTKTGASTWVSQPITVVT
jgi:hypothetical protein